MICRAEALDTHRGNLYRLLAECYRYPTSELGNVLEVLQKAIEGLDCELGLKGKRLRDGFDSSETGLALLSVSYCKLFVGPFELIAPPYGSVYLEENRHAMGDSTIQVAKCYVDAGLIPSQENKEPPDHISTELEFMYYLVFQYLKTKETHFMEKQKNFFLTLMYPWIRKFASDIIQSKIHPFYTSLAVMTSEFLASEANQFNGTGRC